MIHCTQIDKLNMHYIAKYQYVKLLHFLRVHQKCLTVFLIGLQCSIFEHLYLEY
jgi:hypothetical protein